MLITSRDVLDNFKALWQAILVFVTARTQFGGAIKAIQDEELNQAGTTTGSTEHKHQDRVLLCDAAALVGGAIAAWAETQGNQELYATVDFSAADLMHLPEQDCATHCQAVLDAGIANLTALATGQSLAQADLDDLQAKLGTFNTDLTRPRQLRTQISAATNQIPKLITSADRIAERQLDKLMERFKNTNADFYAAYQVARVIVSQGGGAGTPAPPAPAPAAPKAAQASAPPTATGLK